MRPIFLQGDFGLPGPTGNIGAQGVAGAKGPTGPSGQPGDNGAMVCPFLVKSHFLDPL